MLMLTVSTRLFYLPAAIFAVVYLERTHRDAQTFVFGTGVQLSCRKKNARFLPIIINPSVGWFAVSHFCEGSFPTFCMSALHFRGRFIEAITAEF